MNNSDLIRKINKIGQAYMKKHPNYGIFHKNQDVANALEKLDRITDKNQTIQYLIIALFNLEPTFGELAESICNLLNDECNLNIMPEIIYGSNVSCRTTQDLALLYKDSLLINQYDENILQLFVKNLFFDIMDSKTLTQPPKSFFENSLNRFEKDLKNDSFCTIS